MANKSRKAKGAANRRAGKQRIVGLLVKAAEAQDDLAATYRKMKWDCAADTAESEALEFRRRAESFKAKQPNAGPSDCSNAASCEARGSTASWTSLCMHCAENLGMTEDWQTAMFGNQLAPCERCGQLKHLKEVRRRWLP